MIKLLLLLFVFSLTLQAKTLDNVTMPETLIVKNKKLLLNGMGTRKATWFKVKVYVGGLYLALKTDRTQKIFNMDYPKYIKMHFLRDVSKDQMIDGWNEAFENALMEVFSKESRAVYALMADEKTISKMKDEREWTTYDEIQI